MDLRVFSQKSRCCRVRDYAFAWLAEDVLRHCMAKDAPDEWLLQPTFHGYLHEGGFFVDGKAAGNFEARYCLHAKQLVMLELAVSVCIYIEKAAMKGLGGGRQTVKLCRKSCGPSIRLCKFRVALIISKRAFSISTSSGGMLDADGASTWKPGKGRFRDRRKVATLVVFAEMISLNFSIHC